jgi:high-affinity nickel-transport protein
LETISGEQAAHPPGWAHGLNIILFKIMGLSISLGAGMAGCASKLAGMFIDIKDSSQTREDRQMPLSHETLWPLVGLAFVLGLRHGMDADHLATIDGLTRFNMAAGRHRLARLCGFLFSLGHGAVVCSVALTASTVFHQAAMPAWLDVVGLWISVFFLLALGCLNLYTVFSTPAHQMVSLTGIKGRWLGRLNRARSPGTIALVGALFAISFDTLTQAALMSAASAHFGGTVYALLLALSFVAGMIVADAANGWWISHLLRRADATARSASRIMGLTVAMLSLGVAALGLSRHYLPQSTAWQDGKELALGLAVVGVVACSFLVARYQARRIPVTA